MLASDGLVSIGGLLFDLSGVGGDTASCPRGGVESQKLAIAPNAAASPASRPEDEPLPAETTLRSGELGCFGACPPMLSGGNCGAPPGVCSIVSDWSNDCGGSGCLEGGIYDEGC